LIDDLNIDEIGMCYDNSELTLVIEVDLIKNDNISSIIDMINFYNLIII